MSSLYAVCPVPCALCLCSGCADQECSALRREIFCTIKTKAQFDVCVGEEERLRFVSSGVNAVQDAFAGIDSSKAEGGAEDKAKITAAILANVDGGFLGLDTVVQAAMRDVLLRLLQEEAADSRARAGGKLATHEAVTEAFAVASQLNDQGKLEEAAALWLEVIEGSELLFILKYSRPGC